MSEGGVVSPTVRERLHPWRPLLRAAVVLLVATLLATLVSPTRSKDALAIDNPGPAGAQALVVLLRDQGVEVRRATSVNDALDTAAGDPSGTTIALVNAGRLSEYERAALAGTGADVVVLGTSYQDLTGLGGITGSGVSAASGTVLTPQCSDADARAAESLDGSSGSVRTAGGAVGCFPVSDGAFAYATEPLEGGGTLRVLADASAATNARLAEAGDAALTVRALGHRPRVVWLDASLTAAAAPWETASLPPWVPLVGIQAVLLIGVLAVVRGRRFGRLVPEDMPVVVRAAETTRGRGRLYRLARDRDRAAQALRAGAAARLGRRLGLPPVAVRGQLVEAVARATGMPPATVENALYGPPPDTDDALTGLAALLDRIENEVSPR